MEAGKKPSGRHRSACKAGRNRMAVRRLRQRGWQERGERSQQDSARECQRSAPLRQCREITDARPSQGTPCLALAGSGLWRVVLIGRRKTGGESPVPSRMPFGGRSGSPLASALPEPRLCSQGDPPHRPSLTALPPIHLGFRPLTPKNAVRVSRKGDSSTESRSHEDAGRLRFVANDSWIDGP